METIFRLIPLIVAWQCLASPLSITPRDEKAINNYRLDDNIIPSEYDIKLTLPSNVWENKTFNGACTIKFTVINSTTLIQLHRAPEMIIGLTSIKVDGVGVKTLMYDTRTEIMMITTMNPLAANTVHKLEFPSFVGTLYEDMKGFYISKYKDAAGIIEHKIASTQFEPTHARKAFPCFDEPKFKAVFKIQFTVANGLNLKVLANQKVSTEKVIGTDTVTAFEPTPKMSTYLIAFVVHDFEKVEVELDKYRIFAPSNLITTAEYAKSVTKQILEALNTFTGLDYWAQGMDRLDQVAIPDFSAGAMENWGLVTYRETALLWDAEDSTYNNKQRVASVIAHEFAHMWFGNLVTLNWWSSTWLNEGFATYFEYHTTGEVETDFEMKDQFVIKDLQPVLQADSDLNTQSLTSDAQSPSDISAKFGTISYSKGGSIIRMMERFMGQDKFKAGIQKYLAANKLSNTEPAELLRHFDQSFNGILLGAIMENWIKRSGHPVVTASLNENNQVVLNQKRFLYNQDPEENTEYYVPITYTTATASDFSSTLPKTWLEPSRRNVVLPDVLQDDEWIILNIQQSGYYRVNYDEKLWQRIIAALTSKNFGGIDRISRSQIVDDSMQMARASIIPYDSALKVTSYLVNETDYYPWYSAFQAFSYLRRRLDSTEREIITKHMEVLMTNLYKSVSFDLSTPLKHVEMLKTVLALQWACELDVQECVTKSKELYAKLRENETANKIDANLRSIVYCSALRHGTSADWEFLWEKFKRTKNAAAQVTILSALGCTKDTTLLDNYLAKSLENTDIRQQDAYSAFTAVLTGNPEGVGVAFNFLKNKYTDIRTKYGSLNALSNVITSVADRLTSQAQVNEFETFINEHRNELDDAATVADKAIATAKVNLAWVNENRCVVTNWMADSNGISKSNNCIGPASTPTPGSSNVASMSFILLILSLSIHQFY